MIDVNSKNAKKIGLVSVGSIVALGIAAGSIYTVPEGHIGVVRTFNEVTGADDPGLHFKLPVIQSVQEVEVRPRKYTMMLSASTTKRTVNEDGTEEIELQMPSNVAFNANYSVDPDAVKDIVITYGSIAQFEDRILDPRVRQYVLATFPQYTIEQIMAERTSVSNAIAAKLLPSLDGFPVTMTDVLVAGVDWNPKIKAAVLDKQNAKLKAEKEAYTLEQQELQAQQAVNTASADAEATRLRGDAEAYAIRVKGEAEASAIKAKGDALRQNPNLIGLIHEERWDGRLPNFLMGEGGNGLILQMPKHTN